jgi:hypothetical protein
VLSHTDLATRYARERHREFLATAEHDRLVTACERPLALSRRAARPLGRALLSISTWLLRYGKDEGARPVHVYSPPARSIKLN